MLFSAEIEIDGKTFKIICCEYSFDQKTDAYGKPHPKVSSGTIKMTLVGSGDETALAWAANKKLLDEGIISIYKAGEHAKYREIKFENAYCVYYKETIRMSKEGGAEYRHQIEVSAGKLTVAGVRYDNHWPE